MEIKPTAPEAPLPDDVAVCAGCNGRSVKISRNMNKKCAFCGSFKAKRNPVRPKVCKTCVRRYCKYIPGGQLTCKHKITPPAPVSKTRLATAGEGLGHFCGQCRKWTTPACYLKRGAALACHKFIAGPIPLLIPAAALAQCYSNEGDKYMKNKPVALLILPETTAAWMAEEVKRMRERSGGNFGLTTLARSIMNAACKAKLNLDSCRNEHELSDLFSQRLTTGVK